MTGTGGVATSYFSDYHASPATYGATPHAVYCVSDYLLLANNSVLLNETCTWQNSNDSDDALLSNASGRPETRLRVSVGEAVALGLLMGAVIVATILGNLLVILAVLTYRPLKTVQNYLIVSLSVADCAVALVVMPLSTLDMLVEPWLLGTVMCDLWTTMDVFCCTASILNLCAIAIDRYFAIHDPISYACKRTAGRMAGYIALVYVSSACVSIPPLFGWKPVRTDWQCMLSDEKAYVIVSACVSFYLPCLAMCFIYCKIFLAARRRLRKRAAMRESPTVTASNAPSRSLRKNHRDRDRQRQNKNDAVAVAKSNESYKLAHLPLTVRNGSARTAEPDENSIMLDSNDESDPPDAQLRPLNVDQANPPVTVNRNAKKHSDCFAPSAHDNHIRMFESDRKKISLTKERRAARTLGILMACFLLCWVPFFIYYVITPWCDSCQHVDRRVVVFVTWLGYANSLLNPPLYVGFNIDYRRAFRRLLHI